MPMQYCAICDRSFSRPQHLVRHNRIHTGETPYKCLSCTDSFKRADMLKRHVIQSHSTDGRPRQETASGSSKRKPTGRKPTPFASPGKDTEETREDGQRLITRQSGGAPLRLEKSENEEGWQNGDSLDLKDLVRDYASTLYSFNIAILSTLPLTKGTAPAHIEQLHYESHLQLHVNPHLGTPPLLYTPQIHLGIEEDDYHVEGRLGGNQLPPDFLSVFPMTIFERRSLRKALIEAEIS